MTPKEHARDVSPALFKFLSRQRVIESGYTIVLNAGDNWSDLGRFWIYMLRVFPQKILPHFFFHEHNDAKSRKQSRISSAGATGLQVRFSRFNTSNANMTISKRNHRHLLTNYLMLCGPLGGLFNWVGLMININAKITIAAYMAICPVFMVCCFCNRFTFFFLVQRICNLDLQKYYINK